jgi:hypothetical protein
VNTGQAVLAGVAASLIADFLFFLALRTFDRPPPSLRITRGFFRQTSGETLIKKTTFEFSWESRSRVHVGASLVVGLIVFGALVWLFTAKS